MEQPYATVIVPIIDRAETLAISVETGRAQRRHDIEILIACSGATKPVLEVAHDFARRDGRVRVLDLPSSPMRTSAARHEALHQARSDRIFILQDDDVWFPDHVGTLGAMLDRSDFVTTVSLAATLSGAVVAWPCTFGHPGYRSAYVKGTSKVLYEAHYAFRRSSYDRLAVRWDRQLAGGLSRRLLDAHVANADSVRWASAGAPTALSLNSPPRSRMSTAERAGEMAGWLTRFAEGETPDALLSRASYAPILQRLLSTVPPGPCVSLGDYLAQHGLRTADQRPGVAGNSIMNDEVLEIAITERQRDDLATVFSLAQAKKVEAGRVTGMLADMIEPFADFTPSLAFVNALQKLYGLPGAIDIVNAAAESEPHHYRKALLEVALASLCLKSRDVAGAGGHWCAAEALSAAAVASAFDTAAAIALAEGRKEDAIALLTAAFEAGNVQSGHVAQLVRAHVACGQTRQADEVLRRGLVAFPNSGSLRALAAKMNSDAAV